MLRKNKEIWEEIKKVFDRQIEKFGISEEDLLQGIYYYNGNDGTEFDIEMNDKLCEIGRVYNDKYDNYFAIKLNLRKNGTLEIYTYPCTTNIQKCFENEIARFVSLEEFNEFASNLCEYTDDKKVWDAVVDESIFDKDYYYHSFNEEDEEDY